MPAWRPYPISPASTMTAPDAAFVRPDTHPIEPLYGLCESLAQVPRPIGLVVLAIVGLDGYIPAATVSGCRPHPPRIGRGNP
jgi:hypothetical protein